MLPPLTVHGKQLTADTDYTALAADALSGNAALSAMPSDTSSLEGVFRFYDALGGSPYADLVSRGMAAALTHPNAAVRASALFFFEKYPRAAGAERAEELSGGDRVLFDGVRDPDSGYDLGQQLSRVVGARLMAGYPSALAEAWAQALRPGGAFGVIAALTARAREWTLANADRIVRGTPSTFGPILYQLQSEGPEAAIAFAGRIARLDVIPREKLISTIRDHIANAGVQDRIIAALG